MPLLRCRCALSMTLLCMLWVVHDELFVQAECRGRGSSHYALLLRILLVPQAHLHAWLGTLSYDGMGGPAWPAPHQCLEG